MGRARGCAVKKEVRIDGNWWGGGAESSGTVDQGSEGREATGWGTELKPQIAQIAQIFSEGSETGPVRRLFDPELPGKTEVIGPCRGFCKDD